jgi:signal transduction histidine kinase
MRPDTATNEKVWLAERQIALVRLLVVIANTLVYLFLMDKAGTIPALAYVIITAAFVYTAWVLRGEPYRRFALLGSTYFTSTLDALFIIAWIYATGSYQSPFYLLLYISITAVAFRYGTRETIVAAIIYAGAYVALLIGVGQVAGHEADVTARLAYVALFALLAGMMSREVLRQTREAQEAVSARDKFISIASHELRTPLTTLRLQGDGLLRLLDLSRGPPDLEAMRRRLMTVVGQASRLDELMSQMLDVSRISAGRLDLDLQPTDLRVIATEVVSRFEGEVASTGATISVGDGPPVVGRWDPVRVDQIVTNLVGNAVRYGAGRPIEVALNTENGHARLVVRDYGIGIDREQQAKLFHRFERLAGRDAPGGIGLGLWITRQFVEAMSGSITVESDLGKGATFVINLPIEPGKAA